MEKIVKLGYKELKFRLLYWVCLNNFYYYDVSDLEKEKLRETVKEWLVFYYSKNDLLKEPIKEWKFIDNIHAEKDSYKIVKIQKKELEMILVKNKLGGYLTCNIVQEKEFDKTFDELYPKLIERLKHKCAYERDSKIRI